MHGSLGSHCSLYKNWRDKTHTTISKSWESLHTHPAYKGLCVAVHGNKINNTFPERLDYGLAPARAVFQGTDPGVR